MPTRVLVVEDDPAVLRFLSDLLTAAGHEIITARNGVEAFIALTTPPPELPQVIILDLGLPLESGVTVLSFLRTVLNSGVPVVVLTGSQNPEEEHAVRELGISIYLRKPASPQQILAAVSKTLV